MKKRFSLALAACMLLAVFTACGGGGGSSGGGSEGGGTTPTPAATGGEAVLDFLWFSDGNEGDVMQSLIDEYEAQTPGVTINLITVPFEDIHTRTTNLIQGGTPPALARVDGMTRYWEYCLTLDDIFDYDEFTGQYFDSITAYYTHEGSIVALPHDTTANGLILNKTLFDQAGVSYPKNESEIWTWQEFCDAIEKVQQNSDAQFGVVWDGNGHRYTTMLYEWGGRILTPDLSDVALTSDESIACLTFFVEQFEKGIFDTSCWLGGENPNNLFRTGLAAAHVAGNWMVGNYSDIEEFEWVASYMPVEEMRATVPGGKYIEGFDETGVEAETKAFIAYLAQPEIAARYCEETMLISPRVDQTSLNWASRAEDLELFSSELLASPEFTGDEFSYPGFSSIFIDYHTNIIRTIMGELTPEQAMQEIVDLW